MVSSPNVVSIPSVIPKDLDFPPLSEVERTMGRRGQIQGASIVTNPDANAKNNSITIC